MKRIEVKLSLPVVAPLLDIIKGLAGDLKIAPAVESAPIDTDGELRAAWAGELIAGQSQDLGGPLALFGDEFFADGVVRFDGNNADAIARACSAVRLRLRERYLKGV